MGCLQGAEDILARAGAGINKPARVKLFERTYIVLAALTLSVRGKRAADIGAFLPCEPEPMQILEHRGGEFGFGARSVQVFVPKDENAAMSKRAFLGDPKGARVAEVQESSGRGGEPAAV